MSVLARQGIRGRRVQITRPTVTRLADGSRSRVGLVDGTAPDATVLQADVRVQLNALSAERREHVFGASVRATDTIRVPLTWALQDGDHLALLDGPDAGTRFTIEKVLAYRGRPRLTHAECAIVALPAGAR